MTESQYPDIPINAVAGKEKSVVLRGFETVFIDTLAVDGYQTVYVPGSYGRRHYHPGHLETVRTRTFVAQQRESTQFLEQATDRMEAAGFIMKADPADYIVEVKFTGPFVGPDDPGMLRPLLWLVTAFTADWDAQFWKARLKIYDNRSGKLLFTRDYAQEYSVSCWSIFPLFGPACYERTERNYMQAWCLQALTDKVTSEAAAVIAGSEK